MQMLDHPEQTANLTALPSLAEVKGVDLHMHSTASDGKLAPTDLVDLCHTRGITHMALTDHDSVAGVAEAQARCNELGMTLIPAAELSCQWRGQGIHIVALLPEGADDAFLGKLEILQQARDKRAEVIAQRLEKIGLHDGLNKVLALAGNERSIGRPDFAQLLVNEGIVADMSTAFKRYLGAGKRGDVKAHWPELKEVVEWIVQAKGIAVVAHPLRYGMTRRKRDMLFEDFIAAGGEAAELVSGYQNPDTTFDLARQLDFHNLFGSIGSDFHFPGGPIAPGTISQAPKSHVKPVWEHPKLAPMLTHKA